MPLPPAKDLVTLARKIGPDALDNWTVNQHMGVTQRSQATIRQLKDGIELVAQWERGE